MPTIMLRIHRVAGDCYAPIQYDPNCVGWGIVKPILFVILHAPIFFHCDLQDLVLRVCFILGNLTAKLENARSHLFTQSSVAIDTLIQIFSFYSAKDRRVCTTHEVVYETNSAFHPSGVGK